jgi:hypothetical protein
MAEFYNLRLGEVGVFVLKIYYFFIEPEELEKSRV